MSLKNGVKQLLISQQNKSYQRRLKLRKVDYQEWVSSKEKEVLVTLCADKDRKEDFVLICQKQGKRTALAMDVIATCFAENPNVEIVYGDEDQMLANGRRGNPWYKPAWSPDLYDSHFYLGSVIAVRRTLWNSVQTGDLAEKNSVVEFEHLDEIRELVNELIRKASGYKKGCRKIARVNQILFSVIEESIWEEYLAPTKSFGKVEDATKLKNDKVSVIIPSKDNPKVLGVCLNSLYLEKRTNVEVVIVDNGSNTENKKEIEKLICEINSKAGGKITYLYQPMEFNFSRMCNLGAESSSGRYLLFLNDDMEMCDDDWLEVMQEKAAKEYVGAVGLKLYYPQTKRMQHAGIVNSSVGPMHKLQFQEDNTCYYYGRNVYLYDCVAVTGACLMLDRNKFQEIGGFKEELRVAYNDVELGFALVKQGYKNVVINTRYAYHHESLSRGNDNTAEKIARLEREKETLYGLHPEFIGEDPFYPGELNRHEMVDFRVIPNYVYSKNSLQMAKKTTGYLNVEDIRWDPCLLIGVEVPDASGMQGYGVVLGDNNACYEMKLVLIPLRDGARNLKETICVKLDGQYREDLEENMPDQCNVALSGFCVNVENLSLADKDYEIAVMAVNKINGSKLMNSSNRILKR